MDLRPRHYAHSLPSRGKEHWEALPDHLVRVADGDGGAVPGASHFAAAFGAEELGRLLGLWHDLGKYSAAFQNYIGASDGTDDAAHGSEMSGKVDHSTAGARHAANLGPWGRILAYCIAGHHAGLPDDVDKQGGTSGLSARLDPEKRRIEPIDAAPADLLERPLPPTPQLRCDGDMQRLAFAVGFLTRMLFSCLVDADFLATEAFMDPERASRRPGAGASPSQLLTRLNDHLDGKRKEADATEVNRRRREILAACREKAKLAPGLFSLNVPTGGGKTLSSLAFALEHAAEHGLRRVVYAIPFTSIIEQTADVFRKALGEEFQDEVLEHHGNLDPDDSRRSDRSRLASENFDAPLIVTTNVQLFESLFAARPSRCRKLHRLARSVIILDEAQSLPPNLLAPTLAALEELVNNYGATVLLCTATQPAIEKRDQFPIGLSGVRPIIDEPRTLHLALRRTRAEAVGTLSNEELVQRLRAEPRVLCVVNSRRYAADLLSLLDDPRALHLSASMCAAHRSKILEKIRARLSCEGKSCRVVSTQVIEAGVDVDFPAVYRAAAGLDSVAQAAGRCNREGKLALGRVVVFDYDAKAYPTSPMIRDAAKHFRELAPDFADDLLSPEAIETYFRLHYWQQGGDGGRGWDKGKEGKSVMLCFGGEDGNCLSHQFRDAADAYRLIDDAQTQILVPYGRRGVELIDELTNMSAVPDPKHLRRFDRAAQRYTVGVYDNALRKLLENGVLAEIHGRVYLKNREAYNPRLGLTFEAVGFDIEELIK